MNFKYIETIVWLKTWNTDFNFNKSKGSTHFKVKLTEGWTLQNRVAITPKSDLTKIILQYVILIRA